MRPPNAREGIKVRVILDRLCTLRCPKAGLKELVRAGGKGCLFSPFLHLPLNGHFNLPNHRKMVIADGRSATNEGPRQPLNAAHSAPGGPAVAPLAPSRPDIPNDALHDTLIFACNTARQRIWIITPYFLPTQALFDAFCVAGQRGLYVRILVSDKSNHRFADIARAAYRREFEAHGCHMHFFAGGMVHAKALLIDGTESSAQPTWTHAACC